MNDKPFDVFLAHNSQDKPQVKAIANKLKQRGLKPWLDEEQIPPGRSFQDEIQQAIPNVKSAAIFIGLGGLGQWQVMELRSLTSRCVTDGIPVIPILLPGVGKIPDNLLFLQEFNWVSFARGIDDIEALDKLQWGIIGQKQVQMGDLQPKAPPSSTPQPGQRTTSISVIFSVGITTVAILAGIFFSSRTDQSTPRKNTSPTTPPTTESTPVGDYEQLEKLLIEKKWQEADQETWNQMLKVAKTEKKIGDQDIINFSCKDLRHIDRLWRNYSNNKFGFSVQLQIYKETGDRLHQTISYKNFSTRYLEYAYQTGWYNRELGEFRSYPLEVMIIANKQDARGTLPYPVGGAAGYRGTLSGAGKGQFALISRADICKL
ncbi:MAG: GUN4 domain-containing protein [Calothrix sp. MO_192.B10]|nr:GUN4 domain-containing protein [Calothrix sp. MO_192.B10]